MLSPYEFSLNYKNYPKEELPKIMTKKIKHSIYLNCSLEMIKYLYEIDPFLIDRISCIDYAIKRKKQDVLMYLLDKEPGLYNSDYFLITSLSFKRFDIFLYLFENFETRYKKHDPINLLDRAYFSGSLKMLSFVYENYKIYFDSLCAEKFFEIVIYKFRQPIELNKYLYSVNPKIFLDDNILHTLFSKYLYINKSYSTERMKNQKEKIEWLIDIFLYKNKNQNISYNSIKSLDIKINTKVWYSMSINIFYDTIICCNKEIIEIVYNKFKNVIDKNINSELIDMILYLNEKSLYLDRINRKMMYLFDLLPIDFSKQIIPLAEIYFLNHNVGMCNYLFRKHNTLMDTVNFTSVLEFLCFSIEEHFNAEASIKDFFKNKENDLYSILNFIIIKKPDIIITKYSAEILCSVLKLKMAKKIHSLYYKNPEAQRLDYNKIFFNNCKNWNIKNAEWIIRINPGFDVDFKLYDITPLIIMCSTGNLKMVKWLYSKNRAIDLSFDSEYAFCIACENNFIDIAKWLYKKNPVLDISIDNEYPFICSVRKNNIELVRWLLEIKPDINFRIFNHCVFEYVCENNYVEISKILTRINPKYVVCYDRYNNIEDWNNFDVFHNLGNKIIDKSKIEQCCVCFENSNVLTVCNHYLCLDCLYKLKKRYCPYCRGTLHSYYDIKIE